MTQNVLHFGLGLIRLRMVQMSVNLNKQRQNYVQSLVAIENVLYNLKEITKLIKIANSFMQSEVMILICVSKTCK